MEAFFKKKILAAILFLACLFTLSVLNARSAWGLLQHSVARIWEGGILRFSSVELETAINAGVYQKYRFIEAFGYLQRVMGKNEQSDFETIKDKDGALHSTRFADEPDNTVAFAGKLRWLKDEIGEDIPMLYLMTPDKYIKDSTEFPTGIPYHYRNETADSFLRMLAIYGIDTADLREEISKSGIPSGELFYKTDSRWKTETNFWAFTELVARLNGKYGMHFDEEGFFTESVHYNRLTYPSSHLGELGKKAGKYYAGVDDFTLIYPKFDTGYTVRMGNSHLSEYEAEGRFEDALLSAEPFQDPDATDMYVSYSLANRGVAHIRNNGNPDGVKIAFLSDSMIAPMASFLSVTCSDVYMIDPAYYTGDVAGFLGGLELDILIVSFCPQNLNDGYFSF